MYLEQIKQLVVLQKVDDEILILERELENLPKEVTELEKRDEQYKDRMSVLEDKIDILKTQQKRLTTEIDDNTSRIKKSKNKLMMAGNTREYHAMMREMDNMEKVNRTREEEKVALAEELENQNAMRAEVLEESATLKTELEECSATLKKRTTAAKKRLNALTKKRDTACEVIPTPVLGRYEFIRSRIENPVIVSVTDGVCSGCYIRIPPQIFNDLQKGEQIISCPNCQRLVYWCEHFDGTDDDPKAKSDKEVQIISDDKPAKATKKTAAKKTKAKAKKEAEAPAEEDKTEE